MTLEGIRSEYHRELSEIKAKFSTYLMNELENLLSCGDRELGDGWSGAALSSILDKRNLIVLKNEPETSTITR